MADVTLSLAELDELRNNIKELESKNKSLEESKMEVTITTIPEDYELKVDYLSAKRFLDTCEKSLSIFGTSITKFDLIKRHFELVKKGGESKTIEYKNLDSVKEIIQKDCENKVQDRINELTKKAHNWEEKVSLLEDDFKVKEERLKKEHSKEIESLKESHLKEVAKLDDEITRLRETIVGIEKRDKIELLESENDYLKSLIEWNNKSFFYKFLNSDLKPVKNK